MTTYLPVNYYGCTYYYINEDPYIYRGSLINEDKEKKIICAIMRVLEINMKDKNRMILISRKLSIPFVTPECCFLTIDLI